MKAKRCKKKNEGSLSNGIVSKQQQPPLLKIKFNISKDSLKCFVDYKNMVKRSNNKTSKSINHQKKSLHKTNPPPRKQAISTILPKREKKDTESPDIVRQFSNEILAEIEDKGISCIWKQQEETQLTNQPDKDQNDHTMWSAFSMRQSFEKSYASTSDFYPHLSQPYYYQTQAVCDYYYNVRNTYDQANIFQIKLSEIGHDYRTTIMIRNIPNKYSIKELSQEIDGQFSGTYDFLYLPCDLKNKCNVGYGFINFINTDCVKNFYLAFHNYRWLRFRSQKICVLTYARLQGLNNLIEHFENSKVLNQKEKYRPIIKKNARIQHLIKTQQKHWEN